MNANDMRRLRDVTDANVGLRPEIVDKSYLDELKLRKPVYVSSRMLKSSYDLLLADGLSRCQGVAFLDEGCRVGAIAHNNPSNDPCYSITGRWSDGECLENPNKIFKDVGMGNVVCVHVFHRDVYSYPESWITGALEEIGVNKVFHIPIKSKEPGRDFWRHVAQDVKAGKIYIFPDDFNYGIGFGFG